MKVIKRPEDPELDNVQMQDLRDFFSLMSVEQLEKARQQIIEDSENGDGAGGVPANLSKAYLIIQELLEEKNSYSNERKG